MSAPPHYATTRSDRPTYGPSLAEVAAGLGITLMEWQRTVADVALEHEDGRLAYRDLIVTVPRQQGKTVLMLAIIVHRMLSAPGQRVLFGAQSRLVARSRLIDGWWPLIRRSSIASLFSLSRGSGMEAFRCGNGSILTLLSTEESAGHGESLDLVVLDECWAHTAATEQAVRPTLLTRPNGQLVMVSTAGNRKSVWWRDKIEVGRSAVGDGLTSGLAYFEWSAEDGADPADPATWRTCMPALGVTVEEATIAADMASMPPTEFARAYLNRWPDEDYQGWQVIPQDMWAAARLTT